MKCSVCGKEVNDHEAGRELDRCILEERGWQIKERSGGRWFVIAPDGCNKLYDGSLEEVLNEIGSPHYSTKIEAAWGLVEKMGIKIDNLQRTYWVAEVFYDVFPCTTLSHILTAPTAPHAICLAFIAGKDGGE